MTVAGKDGVWTGPQLAAQLAALNGVAPAPACHVVFRITRHHDGRETRSVDLPGEANPLGADDLPRWLARRGLIGPEQLRVHFQVIRESVDASGRLMECALEYRLGSPEGPFHGDPARVEFVGPAEMVRWYRAELNGQLVPVAVSPPVMPTATRGAEHFAGELRVLEDRFGPDLQVLDARDPTLFEDAAGLSSIMHLRLPDGAELACGIGWFGTVPFVLTADFPRFDAPLALPPQEEDAVREALLRLGLVRHETRLDANGLAVLARRDGGQALFLLRSTNGEVAAEPYQPGVSDPGTEDQQRWLRYALAHEGLTPLDHYSDGGTGNLIVLTGDAGGHCWRHLIDPDGVEAWRRPAGDSALAVLHRERLAPGMLAQSETATPNGGPEPPEPPEPEIAAPPDSLLAKARAYQTATSLLQAARDIALVSQAETEFPAGLVAQLQALLPALETLSAEIAASQLGALLAETETGMPNMDRLVRDLSRLEAGLQEELALIRVIPLQPGEWRRLNEAAPFGAEVEARFPGCAYDIEEAASCLAFRRPTAAVFHCMKVVQRGLLALGQHVGLPEFPGAARGWGEIMQALRPACPDACLAAVAQLERLRRRWHAVGLPPAEKYTEAEAEAVFQSLGSFMRELATQCEEAGATAAMEQPGIERRKQ